MNDVVFLLQQIAEDGSVPRNVQQRVCSVIKILGHDELVSIKVSRAIHELEDLAEESNIESEVRVQLFNVLSALESL